MLGTSLSSNWRPPSSTSNYDPYCLLPKCNPYKVGHLYQIMIEDVSKLLKPGVLGKMYPDLEGMTPDVAGFGWFQGWNDGTFVLTAILIHLREIVCTYSRIHSIHNPHRVRYQCHCGSRNKPGSHDSRCEACVEQAKAAS